MAPFDAGLRVRKTVRFRQARHDLVAGFAQRRQVVALYLDFQWAVETEQFRPRKSRLQAGNTVRVRPEILDDRALTRCSGVWTKRHQHPRDVFATLGRVRVDPVARARHAVGQGNLPVSRGPALKILLDSIGFLKRRAGSGLHGYLEPSLVQLRDQLRADTGQNVDGARQQYGRHAQCRRAPIERCIEK